MPKLTILLSLILISSTLAKIHSSLFTDPSLLNPRNTSSQKLKGTKSGNVPLYKDENGFYVGVDLLYNDTTTSGSDLGPNTVPMTLSFYTSQTLLAERCLDFGYYDCKKYNCTANTSDIDRSSYFYFTEESYWAGTNLYLDYVNWRSKAGTLIATSCMTHAQDSYGRGIYGILGMGTSFEGKSNFNASKPVFSVSIDDDLKFGELLFKKDLYNHAQSATPVAVLKADRDWVSTLSGTLEIGKQTIGLNAKLIFDLGSESIGLPLNLYNRVLEYLVPFKVKDCFAESTYQPYCHYDGDYNDLPDITLIFGKNRLVIPPRVYVLNWGEDHAYQFFVTLNLKGLSNDLTGPSFVTEHYDNYIVLDLKFMNYYYTVFEYQNQDGTTISLYKSGKGASESAGDAWKFVLIFSVVVSIFCCCGVLFRKKKKDRELIANESIQAPFNVDEHSH